jgi:predicted homoserine dehydrogenase-like protein
MATYTLTEKAVLLRPEDDVAVAKAELTAGTRLDDGGRLIEVRGDIKPVHKVAAARWRRALPSAATKFAPWIIGPVMWPAGHVAAG